MSRNSKEAWRHYGIAGGICMALSQVQVARKSHTTTEKQKQLANEAEAAIYTLLDELRKEFVNKDGVTESLMKPSETYN